MIGKQTIVGPRKGWGRWRRNRDRKLSTPKKTPQWLRDLTSPKLTKENMQP